MMKSSLPHHTGIIQNDDESKKKNTTLAVDEILDEFSKRSFYTSGNDDGDAHQLRDHSDIDRFLDEKFHALQMAGETPDHQDYCAAACAFMGPSFFDKENHNNYNYNERVEGKQQHHQQQQQQQNDTEDTASMTELHRGCSLMSNVDTQDLMEAIFDPDDFFEEQQPHQQQQQINDAIIDSVIWRGEGLSGPPLTSLLEQPLPPPLQPSAPPFSGRSVTPTLPTNLPSKLSPSNSVCWNEEDTNKLSSFQNTKTKRHEDTHTISSAFARPRKMARIAPNESFEDGRMERPTTSTAMNPITATVAPAPAAANLVVEPKILMKVRRHKLPLSLKRKNDNPDAGCTKSNVATTAAEPKAQVGNSDDRRPPKIIKMTVGSVAGGAIWPPMYKECEAFFRRHGHCAIPTRYPENPQLAYWARYVRACYRRKLKQQEQQKGEKYLKTGCVGLTDGQIEALNRIQFCWNHVERKWNETYETIRQGRRPITPTQRKWLNRQMDFLAANRLSDSQVQKLKKLDLEKLKERKPRKQCN
eukprot:scaffold3359_cov123-Cylindrotheca_fusiformis.AAC.19